jgi:magnesium transporter
LYILRHALQVEQILSTVQRLGEFYRSVQEDRMNQILYLLTLVTSIFVPAQFLTGLYGMNFDYMPELGWKYR